MTILLRLFVIILSMALAPWTVAQSSLSQKMDSILQLPSNYLDQVSSKANQLEQKLDKKTDKALQQIMALEQKMKKKLFKTDSLKAKEIFRNAEQKYKELEQRLQGKLAKPYIATLDTMITSIKFLQQNPQVISKVKNGQQKLKDALGKVNGLEDKFQKAEETRKWLKERKEFLKQQLGNLGFAKELKKINKKIFYFQAQITEYKNLVKDHRKAERKTIELLTRTHFFKDFMKKNSALAALFRLPGADYNDPATQASLAGLQTRASVNAIIQNQIAAGGPNAQQVFQENIRDAQNQINQLKNKITQSGSSSSEDIMSEGFKPDNQRVKSFWKKWEIGINTQSVKANNFFPVTTDLSLMAGFRPHDGYVLGVGVGGLIGWGRDIRHIAISSQGINIKSFTEIKLKGSFHFAAGYELNYRNGVKNIEQLKEYSAWSRSGLVGISKIVSVKSKLFKKTKLFLLWDFLSYKQLPKTSAVVFRVGYNF
jgi:hypothetical protein